MFRFSHVSLSWHAHWAMKCKRRWRLFWNPCSLPSSGNVLTTVSLYYESLIENSFSPSLTIALREVVNNIPELKTDIQDGLLKQLSLIIMHRPMPSKLLPPPPLELPSTPINVNPSDIPATALALGTLGNFHFPRHWLEMFLKYVSAVSIFLIWLFLKLTSLVSGIFEFRLPRN